MDGFINLLKPPGMTSSNAVVMVRKMLPKGVRVGHGGTLDPDAAGVLPICVGRATRLFDYLIDKEKVYIAEARLGIETDTQDSTGAVTAKYAVHAGKAELTAAAARLTGWIEQIPPMYSAVKKDGRRMYELARKGERAELAPRPAWVKEFSYLRETGPDSHLFKIICGKGVYIRTLLSDFGKDIGCGAHMSFLLRARAGVFDVQDAWTPEELAEGLEGKLEPLDAPILHFPRVDVHPSCEKRVMNGNSIRFSELDSVPPMDVPLRVYLNDRFVAVAQAEAGEIIKFRAMLAGADI